jgi:hypothetical protein
VAHALVRAASRLISTPVFGHNRKSTTIESPARTVTLFPGPNKLSSSVIAVPPANGTA